MSVGEASQQLLPRTTLAAPAPGFQHISARIAESAAAQDSRRQGRLHKIHAPDLAYQGTSNSVRSHK
eukprot:880873-Amphidinium_carterae.5